MARLLAIYCSLLSLTTMGCALCASPHDCKYAAYGGSIARTDYVHGRVGSIIDPAPVQRVNAETDTDQVTPEQLDDATADPYADETPTPADPSQRPADPDVEPAQPGTTDEGDTTPLDNELPELPDGDNGLELPEIDDPTPPGDAEAGLPTPAEPEVATNPLHDLFDETR